MESARNHGRFAPKRAPCRTSRRRERAFLPLRYIAAFPPFRADQSAAATRRADLPTCPSSPGAGGRGSAIAACPGLGYRPPAVVRYRQPLVNDRVVGGPGETIYIEKKTMNSAIVGHTRLHEEANLSKSEEFSPPER